VLASANQAGQLSLDATGSGRQHAAGNGTEGGASAAQGHQPGAAYVYNIKKLRDEEMKIARHAEQAYEQFVAQWETRPKVRGRSKPAGL